MRKSLPSVSMVVLSIGEVPIDFIQLCKTFNITIVSENDLENNFEMKKLKENLSQKRIDYSQWNAVNARIPMSLSYLKQHQKDYDRVAWSDLRDIYILNDIFSTVGTNDLYWMTECSSNSFCLKHTLTGIKRHFTWMMRFFGWNEAMKLTKIESTTLNGGFGIGGITKMIELLTIWNSHFNVKYRNNWGYDQTLLNWLYYNGYFESIGMTLEKCTQRMCFGAFLSIDKLSKSFTLEDIDCAPVLIHKDFPQEMKHLFIFN